MTENELKELAEKIAQQHKENPNVTIVDDIEIEDEESQEQNGESKSGK